LFKFIIVFLLAAVLSNTTVTAQVNIPASMPYKKGDSAAAYSFVVEQLPGTDKDAFGNRKSQRPDYPKRDERRFGSICLI